MNVVLGGIGAAGLIGGRLAAPAVEQGFGQSAVVPLMVTGAGIAGAGSAVEFAHHAMSGYVKPTYSVDAAEVVRRGWREMGVATKVRNVAVGVGLLTICAAVGLGSAPAKEGR